MTRAVLTFAALTLIPSAAVAVPRESVPLRTDAPVAFTLTPEGAGPRWRFTLRNQSAETVTVVADRRLVSLEFPAPEAAPGTRGRRPRARRCVHGDRPALSEFAPRVTLPPGASHSELLDLRDHCGPSLPALPAGAQVTARYGWDDGARRSLLRSVLVSEGPAVLPGLLTTVAMPPAVVEPATGPEGGAMLLARASGASAMRGDGLRVTVRLENPSALPVWTLYRNTMWSFEVTAPDGTPTNCTSLTRPPTPLRDFFVRLGGRGGRAASLMPAVWCPSGTFRQAGIYELRAVFESQADGDAWNLQRVFTGRVSSAPVALRVLRGDGRYRAWSPRPAP